MKRIILLLLCSALLPVLIAQPDAPTIELSLQQVIKLATDSSLSAFIAENTYYAGYYSYMNYSAQKKPFLSLSTTPLNFNRSVSQQYNFQDSSYYYVEQQTLSSSGNLSLNQNLMKTGGSIYLDSDLGFLKNLNKDIPGQYSSTPLRIGFSQQLFGFNQYKWLNRIEPLKFEKAKKQLIESMEEISIKAIGYFFDMARARINLEIASTNLANADTLYSIGLKRSEIAAITREDLYTLRLALINSENAYENARTDLKKARMRLYSLLRLDNALNIELVLPEKLPGVVLEPENCLLQARENNPDVLGFIQQRLEAQREVERAKRSSQFNARLNASFGLNQQGSRLADAYRDPLDQEIVRVSLNIPLVDWGLAKGQYRLAQKNQQVVEASLEQAEIDFNQAVLLTVDEFNLQEKLVRGAAQADTVAGWAYEITKRRFMTGNADIIRLKSAQSESIAAQRAYINALENYWAYYYMIRRMTLHDFENARSLMDEFDRIIGITE